MRTQPRTKVIIVVPDATDILYLRSCLVDSMKRKETPAVSALMEACLSEELVESMWRTADLIAFYTDHGRASSCAAAWDRLAIVGTPFTMRKLHEEAIPSPELPAASAGVLRFADNR